MLRVSSKPHPFHPLHAVLFRQILIHWVNCFSTSKCPLFKIAFFTCQYLRSTVRGKKTMHLLLWEGRNRPTQCLYPGSGWWMEPKAITWKNLQNNYNISVLEWILKGARKHPLKGKLFDVSWTWSNVVVFGWNIQVCSCQKLWTFPGWCVVLEPLKSQVNQLVTTLAGGRGCGKGREFDWTWSFWRPGRAPGHTMGTMGCMPVSHGACFVTQVMCVRPLANHRGTRSLHAAAMYVCASSSCE